MLQQETAQHHVCFDAKQVEWHKQEQVNEYETAGEQDSAVFSATFGFEHISLSPHPLSLTSLKKSLVKEAESSFAALPCFNLICSKTNILPCSFFTYVTNMLQSMLQQVCYKYVGLDTSLFLAEYMDKEPELLF